MLTMEIASFLRTFPKFVLPDFPTIIMPWIAVQLFQLYLIIILK